jgi:hypothetical protein
MKKNTVVMILLLAVIAVGATCWLISRGDLASDLILYGNVDLRQVELPFNNSERIAAVLVQERYQPSVSADPGGRGESGGTASDCRKTAQLQPPARDRAGPGERRVSEG